MPAACCLNPLVEAAVFEASVESILEEGLGFDRCDVAVVTSIGEGLKLDFLEWDSPEKKALVYRTASDVVLPGGSLVLKAGEPLGPIVAEHCGGALVLFSEDEHDADAQGSIWPQAARRSSLAAEESYLPTGPSETDLALAADRRAGGGSAGGRRGRLGLGARRAEEIAAGLKRA